MASNSTSTSMIPKTKSYTRNSCLKSSWSTTKSQKPSRLQRKSWEANPSCWSKWSKLCPRRSSSKITRSMGCSLCSKTKSLRNRACWRGNSKSLRKVMTLELRGWPATSKSCRTRMIWISWRSIRCNKLYGVRRTWSRCMRCRSNNLRHKHPQTLSLRRENLKRQQSFMIKSRTSREELARRSSRFPRSNKIPKYNKTIFNI